MKKNKRIENKLQKRFRELANSEFLKRNWYGSNSDSKIITLRYEENNV